mmetsp:Transcript_86086/g.278080  ORF Transcript_86086/g.278080 Transcript_86086/m.278080 type:complete len:359 (-) Transcript_86086:238-1314(-)
MEVGERRGPRVGDAVLATKTEHPTQVLPLLESDLGGRRLAADGAVADGKHLAQWRAHDSQALVDQQASAIRLPLLLPDLLDQVLGEWSHADTCYPDHDAVLQRRLTTLVPQIDIVFIHLFHHRVQLDLDALALQVLLHVLANALVEHGQEPGKRLHERHLEVRSDLRVAPDEVLLNKIGELATELDSCGTTSDNDEVQHLLHLVQLARRKRDVCALDDVEHLLPQLTAVLDLLQEEGVLLHAGDAEGVGLRAHSDHQVVVVQCHLRIAKHLLLLHIDVFAIDSQKVALRDVVTDRLDDRSWRHDACRAAHEQGRVEEEGPWGHNRHSILVGIELAGEGERAPAGAEDDDLFQLLLLGH